MTGLKTSCVAKGHHCDQSSDCCSNMQCMIGDDALGERFRTCVPAPDSGATWTAKEKCEKDSNGWTRCYYVDANGNRIKAASAAAAESQVGQWHSPLTSSLSDLGRMTGLKTS